MLLDTPKNFTDFELLDSGNGFRLERWGTVILTRPDPQIIWQKTLPQTEWDKAWAIYQSGSGDDKGKWHVKKPLPKPWIISFNNTKFSLKLSPFKHTGLFAEQAANWEWMLSTLGGKTQKGFSLPTLPPVAASLSKESSSRNKFDSRTESHHKSKILNLFGYTGGATMVLAKAGCQVTHVDASKPSITWANENHALNKLPKDSVRWMLDDAVKFVKRELKRGGLYDGIIMDPPAFGHSPTGGTWKFNQDLPGLLKDCIELLSPTAKFIVINGYATNSSALALNNLLEDSLKGRGGKIEFGELCLQHPVKGLHPHGAGSVKESDSHGAGKSGRLLSTGIFSRWSA
jgi:23S rRNA (cytosine1962-C5)-methyltransferase